MPEILAASILAEQHTPDILYAARIQQQSPRKNVDQIPTSKPQKNVDHIPTAKSQKKCSSHSEFKVPEKKKKQQQKKTNKQKKKHSTCIPAVVPEKKRAASILAEQHALYIPTAVPGKNAAHVPTAKSQKSMRVTFQQQSTRRACRSHSNSKVSEEHATCIQAGHGGSIGCAVRLETRRSRVQPPPRSATFFRRD